MSLAVVARGTAAPSAAFGTRPRPLRTSDSRRAVSECEGRATARAALPRRKGSRGPSTCSAAPPSVVPGVALDRAVKRLLGRRGADGVSSEPSDILAPAVNVVHVRRDDEALCEVLRRSRELAESCDTFCHKALVHVEEAVEDDVSQLLSEIPDSSLRYLLRRDISDLVRLFADLTGKCCVSVKFELVAKTLCPRLHADSVSLRLLVTYSGSGTLYVADDGVDRQRLLVGLKAKGNDEAVLPGKRLLQADCGDVLLLKGKAWPGNKAHGAIHRSPLGVTEACQRLVLTIDCE